MSEQFHIQILKENNEIKLSWNDKHYIDSISYYPAILKESYGECKDNWFNKLYYGDNLKILGHLLKEYKGKIDLVYIDPPFNSKANYKRKNSITNKDKIYSFDEIQYNDKWNDSEYLQFIYEKLIIIRELLSDKGTIFLHCDYHKSHLIRNMLDEIFGASHFINNIIWHYRKWSTKTKTFQRNHDDIIWYSKTSQYDFFIEDYEEPSEGTLKRWKGKKQKAVFDENGERLAQNTEEASLGSPLSDVWNSNIEYIEQNFDILKISIINPAALERIDYPTQKPEALLERIIKATTRPGSLVLDCFMGSGTTQVVAMKLGRRFIGSDNNSGAIQTTTKRLLQNFNHAGCVYPNFQVYEIEDGK